MFQFYSATLNLLSHIPLQSCLSLLCSSKHSRVALDLLDAILSLRNNSYWLVKVFSSFKAGRVHELLNNAIFISHQLQVVHHSNIKYEKFEHR